MENQKNNLRRLVALGRLFDLNSFYSINQTSFGVSLQASFNRDLARHAMGLKFKARIEESGFVFLTRGKYQIVLT